MSEIKNREILSLRGDRQIIQTYVFDAPRELVFKAYTDPQMITEWWGPRNLTTIVEELDLRPGGAWRFIHRDQDGNEYAFRGEFLEIDPPNRLVQTFEWEGMPGHISTDDAVFEDLGGQTRVTSTSTFASQEDRDGMLESGMEDGLMDSLLRLDELFEREKAKAATR